jgi:tyrosine recombinase XerD subunit
MNRFLDLFLAWLTVEKGLSANTRSAYAADLGRYLDYLERLQRDTPDSIQPSDIAEFLGKERERGLAPRSRARLLSAIRMLHRFLLIERYAVTNPSAIIEAPRPLKKLPTFLSMAELTGCWGQRTAAVPKISATGPCWNCSMPPACGFRSW